MTKRQERIHDFENISDKQSLIGAQASFCMNDNRVIFGTITDFNKSQFTLRDKLLKNHYLFVEDITEVIIEKADNL